MPFLRGMRIRNQLFWVMASLITIITILFGVTVYQTRKHDIIEGVDQKLLTAARMTEHVLGLDYHDKIKDKNSISKEDFVEIIRELDDICVKLDLQYLWSVMLYKGEIVFTSASSTDKKVENGKHAWFFELHSNPEAYRKAFETMEVQSNLNRDKWGFIRLLLTPHLDKHGRKYLFGAAVRASQTDEILGDTIQSSLYLCLVLMVLGLATLFVVSRSISRPITRLTEIAQRAAAGNLDRTAQRWQFHALRPISPQ